MKTDYPKGSLLSEKSMEILQARLNQDFIELIVTLHAYFNDYEKIEHWLYTYNSNLGSTPIELISIGRGHKVLQFIKAALDE